MGTKQKIHVLFCLVIGLFCIAGDLLGQRPAPAENYPVLEATTKLRKQLIDLERSQLGVKEKTGKNDGPKIKMFLAIVGLPEGNPWCAAGQAWSHVQLNIPAPLSGYSPDWFKSAVVYEKDLERENPFQFRGGEVVGYWIPYKGRIGHVGMFEYREGFDYYTIEFNYMNRVARVQRSFSEFEIVSDHVGYKELNLYWKKKKK